MQFPAPDTHPTQKNNKQKTKQNLVAYNSNNHLSAHKSVIWAEVCREGSSLSHMGQLE